MSLAPQKTVIKMCQKILPSDLLARLAWASYILADGKIIFDGSPDDALEDAEVRRAYLGEGFRM